MVALIETLWRHFFSQPRVYVSGNLLVYYEKGNKRKHVSPDVFFVRGVEKKLRPNYLIWEEGRGPQVVIELTSSSTRREDETTKFELYRDVLKVREYFLFDPEGEYLDPRLKGYRLRKGEYHPILPVAGRLPSQLLGLHLERDGNALRLWDPETEAWLPTMQESTVIAVEFAEIATERAQIAEEHARDAEERAETAEERAETAEERARDAERENEQLRRQLEELRAKLGPKG
jgi:Uma2 family endonuclease